MKRFFLIALLLALAASAAGAQQDKTSKPYVVIVGHVVTLSWNASTSVIDHYNVYSSATSGAGYARLGSSKTLTFTDLTTISGNTYFYVVTAVDSVGNESAYSNEAVATIP